MLITAGSLIDNKYKIRGTIGSGGMGVVYEAYHLGLERIVAIKMLTGSTTEDDEDRVRFEREALILSRLSHPNIVQFYAYGIWNTVPYIVIERVNGPSLQHFLSNNQSLDLPLTLDIARQVCDGLQHVHANDVLHRDLKPTNILAIESDGQHPQVKLIDFGLAKLVGGDRFQNLTQTGMALGSVMYASPEQCLGQSLDARSDIYSLGCVLYQMLTGYPPYTADNATAMMFQHLNESIGNAEHWSKIPIELQPVLAKCMAKEKERRYSSALALNEDLHKITRNQPAELEGVPVSANSVFGSLSNSFLSTGQSQPSPNRNRFAIFLACLAVCLIGAGSFLSLRLNETASVKQSMCISERDQLYKLVATTEAGKVDEPTSKHILSLVDSYKSKDAGSLDRTELVLQAIHRALGYYSSKKDLALVRRYCKQALEDYHGIDEDHCTEYMWLVEMYHEACVAANCQLSLVPLLEDTLRRYPNAPRARRCSLYLSLGQDYLLLKRYDEARKSANQAASLAVSDQQKNSCKWILEKCNSNQQKPSAR